ncbi:class I SAM-dependent methyltransferase [Candidatus Pelagibacter sp.]|uniref:class I SAM-dependent methyltransferase n=1 Tax=Candidatus Pelagibacter sp. TaxID=2024849 RepID=UPI003F859F17
MNKKKILDYWNLRAGKKNLKCTNDINLEINEINIFLSIIKNKKNVLDIGCGDGELLRNLKKKNNCNCYGIDFSQNLIKVAKRKSKNINYYCMDMNKIKKEFKEKINFDYIITKRSVQNLTSWNDQKKFINQLKFLSSPKTKILLMESSNDGLKKINDMRNKLKLKKIIKPWHNLYLDDSKLKKTSFEGVKLVDIKELFSTYYFTSRVLNAAINPKPSYNDLLNLTGWKLPQTTIEGFSQLRLYEFKTIN